MYLITGVKFITVNFSLRSVPFYKWFIKIFIIQIIEVIETSGGSRLQGLSIHHIIMTILHNDNTYIPKCSPLILNQRTQFSNKGNIQI
jgi:hypothetical protein